MATASDDFNRANGAIGANWAEDNGDWNIVTNRAAQQTAGAAYYKTRYTATPPDTNNYYSECVARSDNSAIAVGPAVRCATSATATFYGYPNFGGDRMYLVEITAGGETLLATGGTTVSGTNYTQRLEANGSALTGTRNGGADVSATDSSLTTGGWGLMAYGGISAGVDADSWNAADLAAAATSLPPLAPRMPLAILAR